MNLRLNTPTRVIINYCGGQNNQLIVDPGVNLAIDDKEWLAIRQHPDVDAMLRLGLIDVLLKYEEPKHEIENIPVIDSNVTDEPMPVQPAKNQKSAKNQVSDVVS